MVTSPWPCSCKQGSAGVLPCALTGSSQAVLAPLPQPCAGPPPRGTAHGDVAVPSPPVLQARAGAPLLRQRQQGPRGSLPPPSVGVCPKGKPSWTDGFKETLGLITRGRVRVSDESTPRTKNRSEHRRQRASSGNSRTQSSGMSSQQEEGYTGRNRPTGRDVPSQRRTESTP